MKKLSFEDAIYQLNLQESQKMNTCHSPGTGQFCSGGGGGSSSGGTMTDLSGWAENNNHREQTLDAMKKGELKQKFAGKNSFTDEGGVTYTVRSRLSNWTTGKEVAGTQAQQRYQVELTLHARDTNGNSWKETVAKSKTWKGTDNYSQNNQEAMEQIAGKSQKLFGFRVG